MTNYTDGKRYAMTLGLFVNLLIDSGQDPAVIMRVVDDEPSQNGAFIRHIEMTVIPNGRVVETCKAMEVAGVHDTLVTLIEEKIVK